MKTKLISIILISILIISSCSLTKKLEKKLIGKYSVEMLKSLDKENPTDAYNNLLKDLLKGSYIQFKGNKTYNFHLAGKDFKGSWYFSEDGKTILTDKKDIKFKINKFTENGLELNSFNKDDEVLMILKKISD